MKSQFARLAGFGLTLSLATVASAGQVTFQVNMSAQTALGNFDPALDAVFVAGDPINGWSTSASPLAPTPDDANIWAGTFDVTGAAGDTGQYKYLMIAGAGTTTWEGNVGPGGATGNRTFSLSDADQTLPVVFFNNVTGGTSVSSDVTFQVDMSVQITLGNFDPDFGTVAVAGEFNGWSTSASPLEPNAGTPGLWVGTLKLSGAADSSVSYKFVMNGATWEGNVGPNGAQNRALTLTSQAQTLPAVPFNNVTTVPVNVPITFQVNLGARIAQGNFDPTTGTVAVAGDLLNNWDPAVSVLSPSASDPSVWTGTFEVTGSTGTTLLFKYVLDGTTWEGNVGPDGTQNRAYTFANTDPQTLPIAHFDNLADLGAVSIGTLANGQLTLSWTAGPGIRLQTATEVNGSTWQDVPNTLGQSSATVAANQGQAFYRLVGP